MGFALLVNIVTVALVSTPAFGWFGRTASSLHLLPALGVLPRSWSCAALMVSARLGASCGSGDSDAGPEMISRSSWCTGRRITAWPCGGIPAPPPPAMTGRGRSSISTSRRVCERGKFDMVFFADLSYIPTPTGLDRAHVAQCRPGAGPRPIPLLSWMAREHVDDRPRLDLLHQQPAPVLCRAALGDARSPHARPRGVERRHRAESQPVAELRRESPPADERYDRAARVHGGLPRPLESSWEADAVVMDRELGVFADPAKVHRIEHRRAVLRLARAAHGRALAPGRPRHHPGRGLRQGPSSSPPGLPRRSSPSSHRLGDGGGYFADIKSRLDRAGRDPGLVQGPVRRPADLGSTEAEAREKQALHNFLGPPRRRPGHPVRPPRLRLRPASPDATMATVDEPRLQRMQRATARSTGEPLTVREVAQRHGQSVGLPQIVGTPESVADQLEAYVKHRGRRRLHALADLFTGGDRGVRGSGGAGLQRRGLVPPGLSRRHPARPLRQDD